MNPELIPCKNFNRRQAQRSAVPSFTQLTINLTFFAVASVVIFDISSACTKIDLIKACGGRPSW